MRRTTWGGFTGLTNRMIDSEAFQAVRSVHSVKVLIYFWQKAEYPRGKRKPGQESPIGNLSKITNQGKMSFEYRIAGYRGMRPDQFSKALRELFQLGFIDFSKHGCGVKGDYSTFALSDRWKQYNTPAWKEIPFPDSDTYKVGYRSEEFKERQRKRREQEQREKSRYAKAELSTTGNRSYEASESVNDYGNAELKTPVFIPPSTTQSRSLLRSTRGCTTTLTGGMDKKKVRPLNSRSNSTSAAIRDDDAPTSPKQWQPPLSEIRENVSEILRQCHDSRANDPKFVGQISGQLGEALAGRLDPERVNCDFQWKHGFDGWTTDLLFAVATINLNFMGVTN